MKLYLAIGSVLQEQIIKVKMRSHSSLPNASQLIAGGRDYS